MPKSMRALPRTCTTFRVWQQGLTLGAVPVNPSQMAGQQQEHNAACSFTMRRHAGMPASETLCTLPPLRSTCAPPDPRTHQVGRPLRPHRRLLPILHTHEHAPRLGRQVP